MTGVLSGFFLETIDPVVWAALGVGTAMGLSGVGAAWYVTRESLLMLVGALRECLEVMLVGIDMFLAGGLPL